MLFQFLLTHPLRGATHTCNPFPTVSAISTHTPLAGCNCFLCTPGILDFDFYSHTPCGVQHPSPSPSGIIRQFLLTHPLRGATHATNLLMMTAIISTHTPLAGCNRKIMYFTANCTPYNVGVDFFKNLY